MRRARRWNNSVRHVRLDCLGYLDLLLTAQILAENEKFLRRKPNETTYPSILKQLELAIYL